MSGYDVIGDWGTSRLRLFRVQAGRIAARCDGPGIGAVGRQAQAAFAATIAPWLVDGLPDLIRLCGMAGARDGWVEAPYADCPADADAWRAAAVRFAWRGVPVAIMAGLACTGADGSLTGISKGIANGMPDVMRGEETQIFGAIARDPALGRGQRRIVLPGTHSKWVRVTDGRVIDFRTSPTGELFALLRDRSTLGPGIAPADADRAAESAGFADGLARAGQGRLLASLFAARSMRLRAGRSADWARGYLSGLLIGCEIAENIAAVSPGDGVTLIGDAGLTDLYVRAFAAQGIAAHTMPGDACALAGLSLMEM